MSATTKDRDLQQIGHKAASALAEMVAALECDYDRLAELKAMTTEELSPDEAEELDDLTKAAGDCESREDAEQWIQEDPLSLEIRSGWTLPGQDMKPEEFRLLLTTGGPAVQIVGELDEHGEPYDPVLQVQDWFTPWTDYTGDAISKTDLLTYCRQFYYGEG